MGMCSVMLIGYDDNLGGACAADAVHRCIYLQRICAGVTLAACALVTSAQVPFPVASSPEDSWTHLAGGSRRVSEVSYTHPPDPLPAWIASTNLAGEPIVYIWQAPVAVYAGTNIQSGRVFAVGRTGVSPPPPSPFRLYAISRCNGAVMWEAPVVTPSFESVGAPAIDERNQTVLYCSGRYVQAISIHDGSLRWRTMTTRVMVNMSPLVVTDTKGRTRIFVTDYDGFGTTAKLYCLNSDPYSHDNNPYHPGEIIWSVPIGASSGNSVSYLPSKDGGSPHIYVATVSAIPLIDQTPYPGRVLCFSIDAETAPQPVWMYENQLPIGYFGGLSIAPPPAGSPVGTPPSIYVASYAFFGGTDSANLVKLNAATGAAVWSVPSNRTNSIPVPLPDGYVALASGINSFGTTQMVQLFRDLGTDATLVWDTNGVIEVGGYANQPVVLHYGGKNLLAVGSLPQEQNGPSSRLYLLDLSLSPQQSGFVVREYDGVGGSPAIAGPSLYSIGPGGLVALGPTPADIDIDESSLLTIEDLYGWERYYFTSQIGYGDVNRDGGVNRTDRDLVMTTMRRRERSAMLEGRK